MRPVMEPLDISSFDNVEDCDKGSNDSGTDVDPPDDEPPLLEIVKAMLGQLPTSLLVQLCENWKSLSDMSAQQPIGAGSVCTGSGLDWLTLNVMTEVFASSLACVPLDRLATESCCAFYVLYQCHGSLQGIAVAHWARCALGKPDRGRRCRRPGTSVRRWRGPTPPCARGRESTIPV